MQKKGKEVEIITIPEEVANKGCENYYINIKP